jgi:hypothetical protein
MAGAGAVSGGGVAEGAEIGGPARGEGFAGLNVVKELLKGFAGMGGFDVETGGDDDIDDVGVKDGSADCVVVWIDEVFCVCGMGEGCSDSSSDGAEANVEEAGNFSFAVPKTEKEGLALLLFDVVALFKNAKGLEVVCSGAAVMEASAGSVDVAFGANGLLAVITSPAGWLAAEGGDVASWAGYVLKKSKPRLDAGFVVSNIEGVCFVCGEKATLLSDENGKCEGPLGLLWNPEEGDTAGAGEAWGFGKVLSGTNILVLSSSSCIEGCCQTVCPCACV